MTIRHVVLFEVKEGATQAEIQEMVDKLGAFSSIPGVLDVGTGIDFSGRSEFKVAFTCDFDSRESLNAYIDHPDHMEVVREYLPSIAKPGWKVVDFEFVKEK